VYIIEYYFSYQRSLRYLGEVQTENMCIVDLTFRITNCRFPTRDCIPYVRSGLSQLVIRIKGFRVCALHCVRAITSISHLHSKFCPFRRGHHVSVSRVLYR